MSRKQSQAQYIIDKFGGISRLATLLGHQYPSTVQGWRDTGNIPTRRYPEILEAAKKAGVELTPEDFVRHLNSPTIAAE